MAKRIIDLPLANIEDLNPTDVLALSDGTETKKVQLQNLYTNIYDGFPTGISTEDLNTILTQANSYTDNQIALTNLNRNKFEYNGNNTDTISGIDDNGSSLNISTDITKVDIYLDGILLKSSQYTLNSDSVIFTFTVPSTAEIIIVTY